jgi:hypothetical protein
VPPEALTEASPSVPPKHDTCDTTEQLAISSEGSVIVTEHVAVQPLSSVTVKVYVPAERPVADGETVYGAVPPVAVTEAEPSEPPKHDT